MWREEERQAMPTGWARSSCGTESEAAPRTCPCGGCSMPSATPPTPACCRARSPWMSGGTWSPGPAGPKRSWTECSPPGMWRMRNGARESPPQPVAARRPSPPNAGSATTDWRSRCDGRRWSRLLRANRCVPSRAMPTTTTPRPSGRRGPTPCASSTTTARSRSWWSTPPRVVAPATCSSPNSNACSRNSKAAPREWRSTSRPIPRSPCRLG